jgi:hypothetical protein
MSDLKHTTSHPGSGESKKELDNLKNERNPEEENDDEE